MEPEGPLVYPDHYPPKSRWEQFFIGVRWLGPDLSFFEALKAKQGARTEQVMEAWTDSRHRSLAMFVGECFKENLRWPTPYFLPSDRWIVMAGGPSFDMIDVGDLTAAIEEIEEHLGCRLPAVFWLSLEGNSFGEVVEQMLAHRRAA